MTGHCADCRHWDEAKERPDAGTWAAQRAAYGECRRGEQREDGAPVDPETLAWAAAGHYVCGAVQLTDARYGCVMFTCRGDETPIRPADERRNGNARA